MEANYTKSAYFRLLQERYGIETGRQTRKMANPLCLEARGGAQILPPSCLEDAGIRFVVLVGASLTREVGWSLARHVFDPPGQSSDRTNDRQPVHDNDPYCQPYAYTDADATSSEFAGRAGKNADWGFSTFQRVASAGSWPSFVCDNGLAAGSARTSNNHSGCRITTPARPPRGYYTPNDSFAFARNEEECCGGRRFWQELVQLDDPVRFAGSKSQPGKEHHHLMIPRLMQHLARNCPCRGVVWLGIGAHELKHGRPWWVTSVALSVLSPHPTPVNPCQLNRDWG